MRRLISYAWIIGSLALPVIGVAAISRTISSFTVQADEIIHVVQRGETLRSIGQRYGVTVEEIVQANGLTNPDMLYVGQQLVIPRQVSSGTQYHTVQAGETLAQIARRYGLSLEELSAANSLANPSAITVGQQLVIPGGSAASAAPAEAADGTSQDTIYYLQRGDTLYKVSLVFGVSVADLLALNHLASPAAIYPGLPIRIPAKVAVNPPETADQRTHTVQAGETLASIAIDYGVTVDGLVAANALSGPTDIYVGQVLNLPEPGQGARTPPAETSVVHTVHEGETLTGIALRYGVTPYALLAANGMDHSSQITGGQILSIPTVETGSSSVQFANVGDGLCKGVELQGTGTGYFIRPVRTYQVSQNFHAAHAGIDLATELGTSVFAADGGTVVFAGWNPVGYGSLVVLDHDNGWRTYYAHLSQLFVACGDWVPRGGVLGEVGSTGNSTGPHLHFEMLRFGIAVNPTGYIRFP